MSSQPAARPLGEPLDIQQTAELIGCSSWTVRHRLLPQGLPHLRLGGSGGKILFYRDQVVAWIHARQTKGGHRT